MKHLFIALLLSFPMLANAQNGEKQHYMYSIVTFAGNLFHEGVKVNMDNGTEIKRLKDDKGNKLTFKTPAGALNYLIAKGWELCVNGATTEGSVINGSGSSSTHSYWIMRRPCTKEELEKAAKEAIKE